MMKSIFIVCTVLLFSGCEQDTYDAYLDDEGSVIDDETSGNSDSSETEIVSGSGEQNSLEQATSNQGTLIAALVLEDGTRVDFREMNPEVLAIEAWATSEENLPVNRVPFESAERFSAAALYERLSDEAPPAALVEADARIGDAVHVKMSIDRESGEQPEYITSSETGAAVDGSIVQKRSAMTGAEFVVSVCSQGYFPHSSCRPDWSGYSEDFQWCNGMTSVVSAEVGTAHHVLSDPGNGLSNEVYVPQGMVYQLILWGGASHRIAQVWGSSFHHFIGAW